MVYKLSILIASVTDRARELNILLKEFNRQVGHLPVQIVDYVDNKEISIGMKRQKLLEKCSGEWIVFFDDDDFPMNHYVSEIMKGINTDCDCMGINGIMTTNGERMQTWCHRLGYKWEENKYGYDYIRPIIHFNPVKRNLALKAGFKDIRFGEDRDYSDRLNPLLKKEYFIEKPLFHYRYSTKLEHKKKYGIC